jgi:hypothetical protein
MKKYALLAIYYLFGKTCQEKNVVENTFRRFYPKGKIPVQ